MDGTPDYLALGHITRDLMNDGSAVPGGSALYAAATASRLGLNAAVLTATDPAFSDSLPGFAAIQIPSQVASTFANRYSAGRREQWLYDIASPLDLGMLPESWRQAPIVHVGPVLHECALDVIAQFPDALIGVTPQGWMRRWSPHLPARVEMACWQPPAELLERIDVLVMSIEDLGGDELPALEYARICRLVALTRGAAGLTLFVHGSRHELPALPAQELDPTGAGDVFTAALLVRLYETRDPYEAAHFAAAVAAASVEGMGISAIPTRSAATHVSAPRR